ncbi:hypothetical protein P5V15_011652 [Pogonomyrmex californicus]
MKAKTKIGMGMKAKKKASKKKKRILPTAKRGGVLPILPILSALGSLIGGATSVAKAINDRKAAQRQLEELQRRAMETRGQGLYLAPYKYGRRLYLAPYKGGRGGKKKKRKKNAKETIKIPTGVTTNVQLDQLVKRMRVPYFRDVFHA